MESVEGLVNSLEIKVKQIVDLYVKAKEERDQLINQSVTQQRKLEEQEAEIERLTSQVRELESDNQRKSGAELAGVKEKIGDLVREIDRCIELLNE